MTAVNATEPPCVLFCPFREGLWREYQLRLLNMSNDNQCMLECSQSSKNKDKGGAGYSNTVSKAIIKVVALATKAIPNTLEQAQCGILRRS